MTVRSLAISGIGIALIAAAIFTSFSTRVFAQEGINPQCLAIWVYHLPCGQPEMVNGKPTGRVGGQGCQCQESTPVGPVQGICVAPLKCKATNAPGMGGQGNALDAGLQQLGKMVGDLLQKLMQGGGGGGGGDQGGAAGGGSPVPNSPVCTSFTPTSDQAKLAADPCTYYVPEGTNTGNNVSDILNNLGNTGASINTSTSTSVNLNNPLPTTTGSSVKEGLISGSFGNVSNIGANASSSPQTIVQTIVQSIAPLGPFGDIKLLGDGTTIIFGTRADNSQTSGFFGASGTSGQSTVSKLCVSRPWATNFISYIVPPSFFDSLCAWSGYHVGPQPVQAQPQVTVTQQPRKPVATTTQQVATSTPAIQPKVDIWAAPETVPLGARTSIFWTTQGVASCTETSPDGSFSHTSLEGGASTVPITHDTIFTISCLSPDGTPITDSVTVRIAI